MDCSMPGLPVPHHRPEFAWVHVHYIGDTIQPSHLLTASSPSPQSFPASGTFPMSHLFTSDDKTTEASASTSVLSVNIQGWSPLRLTGLISLTFKGLSGVISSTTVWRHQFFGILPKLANTKKQTNKYLGKNIKKETIDLVIFFFLKKASLKRQFSRWNLKDENRTGQ